MQFSLTEWAPVTLTHVSKSREIHGSEQKHSMHLAWRLEGPNTLLDKFPGDKRGELYYGDPTATVPGVEKTTPHLRMKSFEGPFKMPYEGTGYLLTVEDGPVSGENFELGSCDVNKFQVAAKDGGSIILTFRTQHVGLDEATMGRICVMDGKQVRMMAAPPDLQDGTQPERLTKAQQKAKDKADAAAKNQTPFKFSAGDKGGITDNHPTPGQEGTPAAPTATDIFAAGSEADVSARKALHDRATGKAPRKGKTTT